MNIYYTVEEKYLKVLKKLDYGNIPKAKLLLEEILEAEPGFGKAHYHLACIYYDQLVEYTTAVQHMELALQFDPHFPDAHQRYLGMLLELDCHSKLLQQAKMALGVVGICKACVYCIMGVSYEKKRQWELALENYQQAYLHSVNKYEIDHIQQCSERVKAKRKSEQKWVYQVS